MRGSYEMRPMRPRERDRGESSNELFLKTIIEAEKILKY